MPEARGRALADLLFCVCHVTILTNVNVARAVLRQIRDRAGLLSFFRSLSDLLEPLRKGIDDEQT